MISTMHPPASSLLLVSWISLLLALGGCAASRAHIEEREDSAPASSAAAVPVVEALDAASVRRVVEAGEHQVQACYQVWLDALVELDELDSTPVLEGRILASFLIVADGSVEEQAIQMSDFEGASFESCVLAEIGDWRFPRPADTPVAVELPLFFQPRRD